MPPSHENMPEWKNSKDEQLNEFFEKVENSKKVVDRGLENVLGKEKKEQEKFSARDEALAANNLDLNLLKLEVKNSKETNFSHPDDVARAEDLMNQIQKDMQERGFGGKRWESFPGDMAA